MKNSGESRALAVPLLGETRRDNFIYEKIKKDKRWGAVEKFLPDEKGGKKDTGSREVWKQGTQHACP